MLDPFNALKQLDNRDFYFSITELEQQGFGAVSRLPVSLRIVLESVLRNCDGERIDQNAVKQLAGWQAKAPADAEIPFVVSRIILQDFTGVPLLVDLAAMRDAVQECGGNPKIIEPRVPVDLVVDHSVQVDRSGTPQAFEENVRIEFERNRERYEFLKWGQQAFETFQVVPPAIGIVHQVNLEYLAKGVFSQEMDGKQVLYPDSLVGTDSHTTMINGLGIVGWGVGGIEAEAGMLGQPVYFLTPEVVGVNLSGELGEGVTATDLTLRITELLRQENVVGKFVEFYGEGATRLSVVDRATIANMAPEYGATMGFFPTDDKTLDYLRMTGRDEDHIALVRDYFTAQGLFGIPRAGDIDYSKDIQLDLGSIVPCVAGPKRPQDRIDLPDLRSTFDRLIEADTEQGGFGVSPENREQQVKIGGSKESLTHGSVVIAAITSCTNTSNPNVMIAAGLLAKKAVEHGLKVNPGVKTSLAPGSRVVTEYLEKTGLQSFLDQLGFHLVGYGCTTCIGNSGPLDGPIEEAIKQGELVAASVLSGNRNFEARVHSSVKANFLMSPPLVVAFALAGRVDIDLSTEPLGQNSKGQAVFLKDLWPSREEIEDYVNRGITAELFQNKYHDIMTANPVWAQIDAPEGDSFLWSEASTYIQKPPFFEKFSAEPKAISALSNMRPLAILGDSVTTDHISPAGSIPEDGPAGRYLVSHDVAPQAFNSFGSRRGNDRVMTRGTFANVRIRNLMAGDRLGGYTRLMPENEFMAIYDACEEYRKHGTPLIIFAGKDYGMGSSRDWAAKGTSLLGVRAVVAESFERIHRSNLIGMGVLPLEFTAGQNAQSIGLDGSETFSFIDLDAIPRPGQKTDLEIFRADGSMEKITLKVRIDTPIEVAYYQHGGILPYVLRELLGKGK